MDLQCLLDVLPSVRVRGTTDICIGQIKCDSRQVEAGDIFVAIRGGEERDRHQFIPDALARKASAIVAEDDVQTGSTTLILVEDCRAALALLAARYYNYPDRELLNVGLTGTNGKTTTAFMLRQVLDAAGISCGYVGTLGCQVRDRLEKTENTTPEAVKLHALLRSMIEAGKQAAVLEVSSHALALQRVAGMQFRLAVFTNLSRDHLNFHQTEENYINAKAKLFKDLNNAWGGRAVVNIDDAAAPKMLEHVDVPVFTFGYSKEAQVRLLQMEETRAGMALDIQTPDGKIRVDTRLTGRFNCHNVLATVTSGLALELEPRAICRGIAALANVPGRFERVAMGREFEVIVDYAHTPAALQIVLETARELTRGRLICVFGCGGDRDRGKRPMMGRVAADLADKVYVTSDNPRSESPAKIIDEIMVGIEGDVDARIFPDRREAIRNAIEKALPGDVVVVAGKGHEEGQDFGDRVIDFDDRQVAREALR